MEDFSTRVLEKIKNIKEGKTEIDLIYQDIYNIICQNTKKLWYIIHYVKPTLLFESKNHVSISSYNITYAVEEVCYQ